MFRKLRLVFYDNKEKILITIGVILLILAIIRIIDFALRQSKEEENNNEIGQNLITDNTTYLPSKPYAIISDSNISEEEIKNDTDIITEFVNYGNSKDVESAYNLLSQDCKNEMYQTIDKFNENYFKDIFNEYRAFDIEAWDRYHSVTTYRVKYLNDVMATGTMNEEFIQDYITIVDENGEKKLNINEFISKTEINKKTQTSGLEISVNYRYSYYDYEEYEVTFINNSEQNINLDSKSNVNTVYIQDENNLKYTWFGNEIPNEYLNLQPKESKTYRIKFNKLYNSKRTDEAMFFTDITIGQEEKSIAINF